MNLYHTKSQTVEAMQFDGTYESAMLSFKTFRLFNAIFTRSPSIFLEYIEIRTSENNTLSAVKDDWIVRNEDGTYRVWSPRGFEEMYEKA